MNVPAVTFRGKPGIKGCEVTTTGELAGSGLQQCICAAVVPDGVTPSARVGNKPLKSTLNAMMLASILRNTSAVPVPGELLAGFSFGPESVALNKRGAAKLAGATSKQPTVATVDARIRSMASASLM
jgi:hypothetical protein